VVEDAQTLSGMSGATGFGKARPRDFDFQDYRSCPFELGYRSLGNEHLRQDLGAIWRGLVL
jgi:hypothetical protein